MVFRERSNRDSEAFESPLESSITRAQHGDPEAMATLYREHVGMVYGYLRACGAYNPDDLTSDVFAGVLSGLSSFVGDADAFRSWLMTIAFRRMIDERRQRSRDRSVSREPMELADLAAIEPSEPSGPEPRLVVALTELTPAQREILALRFVADFDLQHVAEITGRPVGAVKSLQHRGLNALRRALDEAAAVEGVLNR